MKIIHQTFFFIVFFVSGEIFAQPTLQGGDSLSNNPVASVAYVETVSKKANSLGRDVDEATSKSLARFKRSEERMINKLAKKDSAKAAELLANSQQKYQQLDQKLERLKSKSYIPSLDTLATSVKFLEQNPQFLANAKDASEKLKDASGKLSGLQNKFQKAEEVKKFLRERKQYFKEKLQDAGFAKHLKKLNKEAYYYAQQVNEYKTMLKDHKKAEKKALELLSKTKLFKDFMNKNGQLAGLFRPFGDPGDPTSQANVAGLQTRAQVNGLIQQQLGASGGQQQLQQNLQQAQSQINELKGKMNQLGGGSSDDIMPDGFKPNQQKTKGFLKRLEYGINMQSQKANGYFPVTSDIGLSIGYKLNDRSTIGIGASYKMGWGENIRNIKITNQGLGLRSFIDWNLKRSFWLTGGYEMNYRTEFTHIEELKNMSAWQQSGLLGVSKQISLKSKFLKKTKVQLLWDFLSYNQVPPSQPILFRIGYSF